MAVYISKLGDAEIVLEAPAGGGLSKGGDSKLQGNPLMAASKAVATVKAIAIEMAKELMPVARGMGTEIDVQFAVRADSAGLVMVSELVDQGQFRVTLRCAGARPPRPPGADGPPRPPRPPGGAPE
jgi:hypothetical protein